jgi:hypothetical protein
MLNRGPGFLAVVRFSSRPTPSLLSVSSIGHTQEDSEREITCCQKRGGRLPVAVHCIPAEDLLPQRKLKGSWDGDKAYLTPKKYVHNCVAGIHVTRIPSSR